MLRELVQRLRGLLWESEPASRAQAVALQVGRYTAVLGRDLFDGQLSMRAMSLVYTTLLSLVPLLALAFSLFKALGAHNVLEPLLLNFLEPLGPQGEELAANVIGFVDNIKVGVLGSLGVGLLIYAAISMIQKVESSFNYIWRIERSRPFSQRFGEYLSVLIVGPFLVFTAVGVTATVMSSSVVARLSAIEPFGSTLTLAGKLLPYLLIIVAFTFVYSFMPNTRVKLKAALVGGVLAGILWQSGSMAFAAFVKGATNYSAIYSGFAIVIFLLIWLYLGWLILLIGCQLAFYVQHPENVTPSRTAPYLSGRVAEYLGLMIVALVGRRFVAGDPPPTEEDISRTLNADPDHTGRVVDVLLHHGILAEAGADRSQLLPGRDLEALTVSELWQQIRRGFDTARPKSRDALSRSVQELLDEAEGHFGRAQGSQSVRAWLMQQN
jgi:membrane protein